LEARANESNRGNVNSQGKRGDKEGKSCFRVKRPGKKRYGQMKGGKMRPREGVRERVMNDAKMRTAKRED